MKKFLVLAVMSMIALSFACGKSSTIEADAKRVADLQKKAMTLVGKASSGDASIIAESSKLSAEAAALSKELENKYKDNPEDAKRFSEAYLKEMAR